MDQITHQVRLANWTKIIEQCNERPTGMTVKQWLTDNGISDKTYYYWLRRVRQEIYTKMNQELPAPVSHAEQQPAITFAEIPVPCQAEPIKDTFKADAVIHTGSIVIGISNSISDKLLSSLLEVARHAR